MGVFDDPELRRQVAASAGEAVEQIRERFEPFWEAAQRMAANGLKADGSDSDGVEVVGSAFSGSGGDCSGVLADALRAKAEGSGDDTPAAWGRDLTVDEVISRLQVLRAEHGNLVVSTGGPEGDVVSDVWFEPADGNVAPNIVIG